jgi:hypothetical protein
VTSDDITSLSEGWQERWMKLAMHMYGRPKSGWMTDRQFDALWQGFLEKENPGTLFNSIWQKDFNQ